jgi:hypothetical protein
MLTLVMFSELAPVDARPLLVGRPVLLPAEVQLLAVDAPGRQHGVHVGVLRVAVQPVDDAPLGEALALVLIHHRPDLLVGDVRVEGVGEAVVRPGFSPALAAGFVAALLGSPRQFVLFELPHELGQVSAPLLVRDLLVLLVGVAGHVARPHALTLALRRGETSVVLDAAAGGARRADGHLEDDAHDESVSPTSPTTRATSRSARSIISSDSPRPPPLSRRAIWLTLTPSLRTS